MSGGQGVSGRMVRRFSSWVSIAVSRDRKSVEHLAGRLVMLGLVIRIFPVASVDDEDAEGGGAREREAASWCVRRP